MNFSEKVIALQDEAKSYILSKIKDGEKLELISEEDCADDWLLTELPQVDCENRYDEVVRYSIIAIERSGESINFHGKALGENFGASGIFSFYQLNANEICFIADYLN
jgi:hypothetical protein